MRRFASAVALASLAIAGLALGALLIAVVDPAIEQTREAIVATRRLEQRDTELGLALMRVRLGLASDDPLAEAKRAVEQASAQLLAPRPAKIGTGSGAGADDFSLATIRQLAAEAVHRQLELAQELRTSLANRVERVRPETDDRIGELMNLNVGARLEALIAGYRARLDRIEHRRRQLELGLGLTALVCAVMAVRGLRVQRLVRLSLEHRVLERTRDLAEANATLTRASRAKTEFLTNTSHELRTPLAAILGFADLLDRDRLETDDRREIARVIRRNGEHLLAMVNDILDITKIEAGKLTIEAIVCSPQQLAQEVCALLRNRAEAKGLSLSLELSVRADVAEIPRWIESDPTRIRQILVNLVGNAIKFTETGSVTVALAGDERPSGPWLRVEVSDTGIGMSDDERARVFADFEQADASTTRRFGGSGLGLAICRRLAAVLGGEITVRSARGQGSTFVFTLPVAAAVDPIDDLQETAIIVPRGIPPRCGLRVLIADDSADIQMLVTRFLADIDARARAVSNGREAVAAAIEAQRQGRPFDLILMDLHMPELDGAEAARILRAAGLEQPIVALTASDYIEDRERCASAGYSDFLMKPIDRAQLIQKIATLNGVDPGDARGPRAAAAATTPARDEPIPTAEAPVFDDDRLLAMVGGDRSVRDAVLALFQSDAPPLLRSIQDATASGDGEALRARTHKLKGMLLTVWAPQAARAAGQLESAVRAGQHPRVESLLGALQEEVARLCLAMGSDARADARAAEAPTPAFQRGAGGDGDGGDEPAARR